MNKLRKVLHNKEIDIAVFYNIDDENINMKYLSGYNGLGLLAVPVKSTPFLIAPKMEYEKAKQSGIKVYSWEKGKRLFEVFRLILKRRKLSHRNIGIVERDFNLDVFKSMKKFIKKARYKDIGEDLFLIRSIKNSSEINYLRKACKISAEVMNNCINNIKKFKTEVDVANYLHIETVKSGCDLSFPSIVASGASASMPHAVPKRTGLKKGFCVIDYGAKYQGYHGDVTRTIYIGRPSKKEKKIYNLLLETQENLINNVKVGLGCDKLYDKTLSLLGKYKDNFTHGLGHGIGLNIHELPNLTLNSKDVFKNNMAFTIEPGVYLPNKFGIRIEDDILLKKNKIEVLSKVSKKLRII